MRNDADNAWQGKSQKININNTIGTQLENTTDRKTRKEKRWNNTHTTTDADAAPKCLLALFTYTRSPVINWKWPSRPKTWNKITEQHPYYDWRRCRPGMPIGFVRLYAVTSDKLKATKPTKNTKQNDGTTPIIRLTRTPSRYAYWLCSPIRGHQW